MWDGSADARVGAFYLAPYGGIIGVVLGTFAGLPLGMLVGLLAALAAGLYPPVERCG